MLLVYLFNIGTLILIITLGILFLLHLRDHEKEQVDAYDFVEKYFKEQREEND